MAKLLKLLPRLLAAGAAVFLVSFTVYFFNLDMKLLSAVEPFFLKHYDKMPRENYI